MRRILLIFLAIPLLCIAQNQDRCLRYSIGTKGEILIPYGLDSVGDGTSGFYRWSVTSTEVDDSLTVVKPYLITGAGRWISIAEKGNNKRIQKAIDKDKTK